MNHDFAMRALLTSMTIALVSIWGVVLGFWRDSKTNRVEIGALVIFFASSIAIVIILFLYIFNLII